MQFYIVHLNEGANSSLTDIMYYFRHYCWTYIANKKKQKVIVPTHPPAPTKKKDPNHHQLLRLLLEWVASFRSAARHVIKLCRRSNDQAFFLQAKNVSRDHGNISPSSSWLNAESLIWFWSWTAKYPPGTQHWLQWRWKHYQNRIMLMLDWCWKWVEWAPFLLLISFKNNLIRIVHPKHSIFGSYYVQHLGCL